MEKLRCLPNLENFVLKGLESTHVLTPDSPRTAIPLKHLRYVGLVGKSTAVIAFLHHVSSMDYCYLGLESAITLPQMLQEKLSPPLPNCTDLACAFSIEDIVEGIGPFEIDLTIHDTDEVTGNSLHTVRGTDIHLERNSLNGSISFTQSLINALSPRLYLVTHCHLSMSGDCNSL